MRQIWGIASAAVFHKLKLEIRLVGITMHKEERSQRQVGVLTLRLSPCHCWPEETPWLRR